MLAPTTEYKDNRFRRQPKCKRDARYSPLGVPVITQAPVSESYNSMAEVLHCGVGFLSLVAVKTTDHGAGAMKLTVNKYIINQIHSYGVVGHPERASDIY